MLNFSKENNKIKKGKKHNTRLVSHNISGHVKIVKAIAGENKIWCLRENTWSKVVKQKFWKVENNFTGGSFLNIKLWSNLKNSLRVLW